MAPARDPAGRDPQLRSPIGRPQLRTWL